MALSLNGSTTLQGVFPAITGYPFTIYCRAQSTSTSTAACAFSIGATAADDDNHALYFRGDTAGDPVQFRRTGPSGAGVGINSVAGYSTNTWVDLCGVAAAANDGRLYANNVKSTSSGSVTFAGGDIVIGALGALGSMFDRLNGAVANCAVWDAALTDDEVNSLYKGFSPRMIRPTSLKFYAPLVRSFTDVRGGVSLTVNAAGTSAVGAHPPSIGF